MQNASNITNEVPLLICASLDSSAAVVFQIIGYICVCFFSLTGNLLIIANFLQKGSSDRTFIDALITNIALSDLIVPLVIVSRELHDKLTSSQAWAVQGEAGEILCKLVSFLGDVASAVSIVSLCIITIERYIIIVSSDSFQIRRDTRNKRLNYLLVAISWLIPTIFNSHFFYTFKLSYISPEKGSICTGPVFDRAIYYYVYNVLICVLFIFIPFMILTTLNIATVLKLNKLCNAVSDASTQEYRRRLKSKKHIKNMLLSMIAVFGLCFGPYFTILTLFTFKWNLTAPRTCSFFTASYVALFMTRANAAINPWIYLLFQKKKTVRFRLLLQSALPLRSRPRVAPLRGQLDDRNNAE